MPRKPRQHVPGGTYHVILRGNDGQPIFFQPQDRELFYRFLQIGLNRFGHRVLAFCCMDTHIHLAIEVQSISLSRIVHHLASCYASEIHRHLGRKGHLFHNRFRAFFIDSESYFLELVRYIHLNPVRAGIVEDPSEFRWSGHRGVLGLDRQPWLSTDRLLSHFSTSPWRGRLLYQQFLRDGMNGDETLNLEQYRKKEDPELMDKRDRPQDPTWTAPPRLDRILEVVCREFCIPESRLRGLGRDSHRTSARGWVGLLARQTDSATVTEVAARVGRDPTTVSRSVCKLESELSLSRAKQNLQQRLLEQLHED